MSERLRYSTLKLMAESPRAYHMRQEMRGSHLRTGSAVHAMVWGTPAVALYDGRRAGREWEAFRDLHEAAGSIVVNRAEYDASIAISDAIASDPVVAERRLLSADGLVVEQRIDWVFMGRPFQSTPDAACPDFITDLKTTRSAKPAFFQRDIMRYSYHVQAAIYRQAVTAAYGYTPRDCYIIAAESKPPHHVVVYRLSEAMLSIGERTACLWMEQLAQCEAAGVWPGYAQHVVDVDPPDWIDDMDDDTDTETTDEDDTHE